MLQPHPQEALYVAQASSGRQREFHLGRACARAALARLGHEDAFVARQDDGAPRWPAGIVGSISHTDGYAVALAAASGRYCGLGVDVERQGRVTPRLYRHLFDTEERARLAALPESERDVLAELMFSAKEACCKLWLGRHGSPQPFTGIRVRVTGMDFLARSPARDYRPLAGRTVAADGLVLAAAWMEA
jgi:4'-phosphopantetheinyl transferase EntD